MPIVMSFCGYVASRHLFKKQSTRLASSYYNTVGLIVDNLKTSNQSQYSRTRDPSSSSFSKRGIYITHNATQPVSEITGGNL